MKRQLIFFLFSFSLLMSCSRTNKLSEDDYKWMPYKENETLVFRSNTGIQDTLFLLNKDTLLGYADPYSLNGHEYEVLSIFGKYSDPFSVETPKDYIRNRFFEINTGKDNKTRLDILFFSAHAQFYRISYIRLDSLAKVKPSVFQTPYANYNDVYVFNDDDNLNLANRTDVITKIYWSKSIGLIRYDKKDSVYWELAMKW